MNAVRGPDARLGAANPSTCDPTLPIALTMGEPAGVGPELTLHAWMARENRAVAPFFVVADPDHLRDLAAHLSLDVPIAAIDRPQDALGICDRALPVLPVSLATRPHPGRPAPANAKAVLGAIEGAFSAVAKGVAGAIVTAPIHKESLYAAGFPHPGHTEFLGHLCDQAGLGGYHPARPWMMLACPQLRVVPITVHLPLTKVPGALSSDRIVAAGQALATALTGDFGIPRPRIAVTGLNPHAGEAGALGDEEEGIIAPAIARLKDAGIYVFGPSAADSLFHEAARGGYDAVLAMYHDQALIPVKALDFRHAVNVTLNLPVVRTSPAHGTAFDLAGTGRADPESLICALGLAHDIAWRRASQNAP